MVVDKAAKRDFVRGEAVSSCVEELGGKGVRDCGVQHMYRAGKAGRGEARRDRTGTGGSLIGLFFFSIGRLWSCSTVQ